MVDPDGAVLDGPGDWLVLWLSDDQTGQEYAAIVDLGSRSRELIGLDRTSSVPSWSPDGRWVAVSGPNDVSGWDLGSGGVDLAWTVDLNNASTPTWDPTGHFLVVTTFFDDSLLVDATTGDAVPLESTANAESATWSPDGRWLVLRSVDAPASLVQVGAALDDVVVTDLDDACPASTFRVDFVASGLLCVRSDDVTTWTPLGDAGPGAPSELFRAPDWGDPRVIDDDRIVYGADGCEVRVARVTEAGLEDVETIHDGCAHIEAHRSRIVLRNIATEDPFYALYAVDVVEGPLGTAVPLGHVADGVGAVSPGGRLVFVPEGVLEVGDLGVEPMLHPLETGLVRHAQFDGERPLAWLEGTTAWWLMDLDDPTQAAFAVARASPTEEGHAQQNPSFRLLLAEGAVAEVVDGMVSIPPPLPCSAAIIDVAARPPLAAGAE